MRPEKTNKTILYYCLDQMLEQKHIKFTVYSLSRSQMNDLSNE